MRVHFEAQLELGAIPIEDIRFNLKSRDDIPRILLGLQHIYSDANLRQSIFDVMSKHLQNAKTIDFKNGRPGMNLWTVLVLGVLRNDLNCDYDRLTELANEHQRLRAMLGHARWCEKEIVYHVQTLKDNIPLLTEAMLQEINVLVVKAGHALKKKDDEIIKGRCDSFVVETHVEYPTDTRMLFDALKCGINQAHKHSKRYNIKGLRQANYRIKKLKIFYQKAQKSNRFKGQTGLEKKKTAYQNYITESAHLLEILMHALELLKMSACEDKYLAKIAHYQACAIKLLDQMKRRVLEGESIPKDEKIFSIFQPHTEMISKGKAGVPFELGIKVCVLEDHDGFILHHYVMQNMEDANVAVFMVTETQQHFRTKICSFDKGFHSKNNQVKLDELLDLSVSPRKCKLTTEAKKIESSQDFIANRRAHSAVESAINGLEQNGLDRCTDHGIDGFKRCVALGVLSRNLDKIGSILLEKERTKIKRRRQCKVA